MPLYLYLFAASGVVFLSFVLVVLFLTGLAVLWWADYADIPDRDKQREILNRLLPELIDTPVTDIRRVEVDRGHGYFPLSDQS